MHLTFTAGEDSTDFGIEMFMQKQFNLTINY